MSRLKILFIMLEFPKWQDASRWGYPGNIGMEPGFIANDIDYYILPALHQYGERIPFWIDYARELLAGRKFDQVWFEITHSRIDDSIQEFVCSLAPIRLGFSFESLELLPQEWENNPEASKRREAILNKRLAVLTHLVTTDEVDAVRLNGRDGLQAKALPPGFVIPMQFITAECAPPIGDFGLFYGSLYGERQQWLEHPALSNLLRYSPTSPELNSPFPESFDTLHTQVCGLIGANQIRQDILDNYLQGLRIIRRECFGLWLEGLRIGVAVVNLPQWGRAYASRVIEGMAAGRPVITQALQGRPLAEAAFEDGKEILLYNTPEQLAEHLQHLIKDHDFGKLLAANARKRLIAEHTTEGFVTELLKWIAAD